jgi:hypothetical protein
VQSRVTLGFSSAELTDSVQPIRDLRSADVDLLAAHGACLTDGRSATASAVFLDNVA